MDEVTRRNFHALAEGLKEQRAINAQQSQDIARLQITITELQHRVSVMDSRWWQYIADQGVGPTER